MAGGQSRSFWLTPDLRSWNLGKGALGAGARFGALVNSVLTQGIPGTPPPALRKGTVNGQSWWFQQNTSMHVTCMVLTAFQTRSLHRGLCLSTLLLVLCRDSAPKGCFQWERGPHTG